ncbi:hypothetical protein ElyMa_005693800 [Elysia marginata]|uniref:Uncharacterized protein n=1 Tax=Elysia marginata TaxID=1093978 RepID=A0AAV4FGC1_9GAST|nr:hypothetical protein ElyMa_005693800 [Elysia marginata]
MANRSAGRLREKVWQRLGIGLHTNLKNTWQCSSRLQFTGDRPKLRAESRKGLIIPFTTDASNSYCISVGRTNPRHRGPTADAQHVLQDCPMLDDARLKYWPEPREMNQKLYGSALQLGTTAEFICASDLTI